MKTITLFTEPEATHHDVTGGKGANLGQLVKAGFQVPQGFVITTEAYRLFVQQSGITANISKALGAINYDDLNDLEIQTAKIRTLFTDTDFPTELGKKIINAYESVNQNSFVAVRSSGTAEDLVGASFAGLHDTYLDVLGGENVLDSVKNCWASLWTARATIYRRNNGFDHLEALLAVVIQTMVSSEVSGVMFTGNPLTAATDEIVINASWGLGESVVSGIVSPDQFTLSSNNLTTIDCEKGSKAVQIIRNPETGWGVIEDPVPPTQREQWSLSDEHLTELGRLGLKVQAHYQEMPQDIEWGLKDGQLYLLQSRPITGVDFSWDADCSDWQAEIEDPHAKWTRVPMDDIWTGAISPLFYSIRGESWAYDSRSGSVTILGCTEISKIRAMKYYRGEAYQNVEIDLAWTKNALPIVRPALALKLPEDMRDAAINAPFGYFKYAMMYLKAKLLYPDVGNPYGWMKSMQHYFDHRIEEAEGLPTNELPNLSDKELKRYARQQIDFEHEYNYKICWPGLFLYSRDIFVTLSKIIEKWYKGDNQYAFTELIAGAPNITITVKEHIQLHEIGKVIRASDQLSKDIKTLKDQAFFDSLENSEDGKKLNKLLTAFLKQSGHRGHADRDIYFPRYADDAGVLFRAVQAHAKSDVDPMIRERENNRRRDEVQDDVEANIRRRPFGFIKAEIFKWCLEYVLRFQEYRDDERHFIDRNTYSIRNIFLEVNRRLIERGLVETERDFWFLTQEELFDLLANKANMKLTRAKIEGRMKNFDAFDTKEIMPPKFLYRNRELAEASNTADIIDGQIILRGTPTSRGTITATARLVKQLSKIDRVNPGEILIANSTDPGWTPVFALISGVIVETGGLLSHSSCLAREYGFPAAQVEGALSLIPDGATITINGDTGEVRIHNDVEKINKQTNEQ